MRKFKLTKKDKENIKAAWGKACEISEGLEKGKTEWELEGLWIFRKDIMLELLQEKKQTPWGFKKRIEIATFNMEYQHMLNDPAWQDEEWRNHPWKPFEQMKKAYANEWLKLNGIKDIEFA